MKKIAYHKSIDTIPIANYRKVAETNNLSYMYGVDILECENIQPIPEMLPVWKKIQQDYNEIMSRRKTASSILDMENDMGWYLAQKELIDLCCNQIILNNDTEYYLDLLDDTDFLINRDGDIKEQANIILSRVENYISKVNDIQSNISKLSNTSGSGTFEGMIAAIHEVMGININPFKITAKQFLTYEDNFIKKVEKLNKDKKK